MITLTDRIKFIEGVFGPGRLARNSRNLDVRCPICDPHDRSKKKLAILVEAGKVHCWVCGFKAFTLVPLIKRFGTREQLAEYRDRFMPADARWVEPSGEGDVAPEPLHLPDDFRMLATLPTRDPDVLAMRRYLESRGITERDLWRYKLGRSDQGTWRRRVIVPSFDGRGELNYYVGRAIDDGRRPKYENPPMDRRAVVFNELDLDWGSPMVICEGTFDMMKCGDNAVPLLGSDLNERSSLFNQLLAHGTPVLLALDGDMRLTKVPRNAGKLIEYGIDVSVVDVSSDPGSMTKEEFRRAREDARPYGWLDSFSARLERASRLSLRRGL